MNKMAKIISSCVIILSLIALIALPIIFSNAFGSHLEKWNQLPIPEISQTKSHKIVEIKPNPFDQSMWSYIDLADEVNCMALNIYFEARDQDTDGQLAVGLVTINRVISKKYPNNVCDVVWQKRKNKSGNYVAQFSWTLDGAINTPLNKEAWNESLLMAEALLAEASLFNIADFTNGADHYHAHYVEPFWSKRLTRTIIVGDHLFYNSKPVDNIRTSKL